MTDTPTPGPAALAVMASPRDVNRPRPNPLTASAMRLKGSNIKRFGTQKNQQVDGRAAEGWEMYRLVGEHRFLVNTLAGRMSQARLFVGKLDPNNDTAEAEVVPDDDPQKALVESVLDGFGPSPAERAQLIARAGQNLQVPGDGWYVGIPRDRLVELIPTEDGAIARPEQPLVDREAAVEDPDAVYAKDLVWRFMSTKEVDTSDEDVIKLRVNATPDKGTITVKPDEVLLIRVWRSDPEEWWRADSPTLSSLPVLRELVGLTMGVSAQIDSRLAGAGVFIVPQSARDAVLAAAGVESDGEDDDPFTDALIEAMVTPISDRSNASAVVPLVLTVPDHVADKFEHITFSTPLDAEARQLREEAIRRLALGFDAPPELLLGMATMNHWGAWLVREDVIVTHVEPPLALVCDALTSQYLWPVLMQNGMSEEEAQQYVIWYSVKHLITRPDRLKDALLLHEAGVISDEALRREAGFDEGDAPPGVDPAIALVLDLVRGAPSLAGEPGIAQLVVEVRAAMEGNPVPSSAGDTPEVDSGDSGTPDTSPDDVPDSGMSVIPQGWIPLGTEEDPDPTYVLRFHDGRYYRAPSEPEPVP